jgi:predicted dinucleotide-utilizing enzyme
VLITPCSLVGGMTSSNVPRSRCRHITFKDREKIKDIISEVRMVVEACSQKYQVRFWIFDHLKNMKLYCVEAGSLSLSERSECFSHSKVPNGCHYTSR